MATLPTAGPQTHAGSGGEVKWGGGGSQQVLISARSLTLKKITSLGLVFHIVWQHLMIISSFVIVLEERRPTA